MVVCDVEVIRRERVCKKEQMQNREDAKQGLVGGPVQTVDKFRGQVPRNFFAIEPEKSALTRL